MIKNSLFLVTVLLICSCGSTRINYDASEIDWSNRKLEELSYNELLKYKNLEKIDLSDNNLSVFPDSLYLLPNLKVLLLSRNKITVLPKTINRFKSLKTLDLFGNEVVKFHDMQEMSNLEFLQIEASSIEFLEELSCAIPNNTLIVYNYELKPYSKKNCKGGNHLN